MGGLMVEPVRIAYLPAYVKEARSTACKHAEHEPACSGYYGDYDRYLCQCPCHDETRGWRPWEERQ